MKTAAFVFCVLSCAVFSAGQLNAQTGSVVLVEKISAKESATNADAVALFTYQIGKQYTGYDQGIAALKEAGLITRGEYAENDPLRRGFLSLLAARYLKLSDSLWFVIFRSERYAYRACVSAGVMRSEMSEWDPVSGPELIECAGKLATEIKADEK